MKTVSKTPLELQWFKAGIIVILTLGSLYLFTMSVVFSSKRISLTTEQEIIWISLYILLLVFAWILPRLAPKYIRYMGNDGLLYFRAARRRKDSWLKILLLPRGRLSLDLSVEGEAEEVLDEREQTQRQKALAFSHRVTLIVLIFGLITQSDPFQPIVASGVEYLFFGEPFGFNNIIAPFHSATVSMYLVFAVLITHYLTPIAYLAWHYQPLNDD